MAFRLMNSRELLIILIFSVLLGYVVTIQYVQTKYLFQVVATGDIAIGQALELVLKSSGEKRSVNGR
jgi:hypothetical protein